jgi:uncharacterized protein YggU (UPF0235/DUF167 family)
MRVVVRVYPGATRTSVGGRYGEGEPPTLIVKVQERAIDGKANEAVLREVARSFGLPRAKVQLVSGSTSRTKLVDLDGAEPARLATLLSGPK